MSRAITVVLLLAALMIAPANVAGQPSGRWDVLPRLFADEGATGMAGPVTSAETLVEGKSYVVRVRGTYSAYDRRLVRLRGPAAIGWHFCGDRVGSRIQDAEFVWGIPEPHGVSCPALPSRHFNLLLDAGAGFAHHAPVSTLRQPLRLRANNRYEYLVTRVNGDGPLSVALRDTTLSDNLGSLSVRVRSLDAQDCAGGGWRDFDGAFSSRADCRAHIP